MHTLRLADQRCVSWPLWEGLHSPGRERVLRSKRRNAAFDIICRKEIAWEQPSTLHSLTGQTRCIQFLPQTDRALPLCFCQVLQILIVRVALCRVPQLEVDCEFWAELGEDFPVNRLMAGNYQGSGEETLKVDV